MLRAHHLLLSSMLLLDGGTVAPPPGPSSSDAGLVTSSPSLSGLDAGIATPQQSLPRREAETVSSQATSPESIRWPENLPPLAVLDGPAVVAANAALQHLLARMSKEYGATCPASAKAMEVIVGKEGGLYFVRIDHHVDRCGWAAPGFDTETHWFELYAVSPDGQVLARAPYTP